MDDLCWNSKLLGAMKEHACLTEEESIVLNDWAHGWSIAKSAMERHMCDSKVEKIRRRLRIKYDGIQKYVEGLPPRKCKNPLP